MQEKEGNVMNGMFSINIQEGKESTITLAVDDREAVNSITLDLMKYCIDTVYEPRVVYEKYESCLLYNEKIRIKVITNEKNKMN